jgi:hypothetical protein
LHEIRALWSYADKDLSGELDELEYASYVVVAAVGPWGVSRRSHGDFTVVGVGQPTDANGATIPTGATTSSYERVGGGGHEGYDYDYVRGVAVNGSRFGDARFHLGSVETRTHQAPWYA